VTRKLSVSLCVFRYFISAEQRDFISRQCLPAAPLSQDRIPAYNNSQRVLKAPGRHANGWDAVRNVNDNGLYFEAAEQPPTTLLEYLPHPMVTLCL
jgi:hypothetical protein